ncbi:uncharacterized protein PHACADRAFT_258223 [Phanerochaete carnosa HHB-10118-sp]|uniref:Mitochondrial carrier n=1 Tax=Phanerochaete carnosa (strain HHB-10118-sp) TaxID=650164 RepID=K5UWI9_PHACS|nr:uncharacterized protein PHACADRAFT_258223 [Phanerochaete carnosa HHB-10118-sp]EKM54401.1 hypothetical protein PHACADRAFT_258223 [Phanerochaete carnosa HHB-10118-sp]
MLLESIGVFLSLGAYLAIAIPIVGALVRLRTNYNPKSIQLDAEGNVEPHTGPIVTSFFGMLKRVKRIEGWGGLYKGTMPALLETVALTLFVIVALDTGAIRYGARAPNTGILGSLAYATVALILNLPAVVVTFRSITTPYRLPWFNPVYSLRVLLTPTERRKPWIIYFTPGLLAAQFLHLAYKIIFIGSLRRLLLPSLPSREDNWIGNISFWKLGIMLAVGLVSTVILCPLEVIASKLAIQRNHAAPEYNSVAQEVEDDALNNEEYAEYTGAEEDVIGLRHEKDPYLGLIDCAKKVVNEEGWQALYRAWWITALSGLANALG